jgi:tRNA (guanine10-N2)-dimethyltransferase
VKSIQIAQLEEVLQPGESFVVRVRRIGEESRELVSTHLERKLGELILGKIKHAEVNLRQPQRTFFGVITDNSFVFGLELAKVSPTPFMQRRPRKRPFFHPSAMPAKLARCMVNLAKPNVGDLLVDPFCGSGSFLVEASLVGCRVLGFDAKRRMVKGSLKNMKFFNAAFEGLGVADAKNIPITRADCIVTDPPYGRSASTMGYTTKQIIQDFLAIACNIIGKRQRICIAAPKVVRIGEIAGKSGLKHLQSHFVYVHRSLTREIVILEKQ